MCRTCYVLLASWLSYKANCGEEIDVAMRSANAHCIHGQGWAGVSSLRHPRCVHGTAGPAMDGCSAVCFRTRALELIRTRGTGTTSWLLQDLYSVCAAHTTILLTQVANLGLAHQRHCLRYIYAAGSLEYEAVCAPSHTHRRKPRRPRSESQFVPPHVS